MYSATFISDNGEKYVFGPSGNTACDIDLGSGISVNIGTSQGFAQVGVTVENQTVDGRTITITGTVYGNVPERKVQSRKRMRNSSPPASHSPLPLPGSNKAAPLHLQYPPGSD